MYTVTNWDDLLGYARKGGQASVQAAAMWDTDRWHDWLTREGSSAAIAAFEYIDGIYGSSGLTRRTVFDFAIEVRTAQGAAAMHFLMAVMLWGYADTDGRGPWRVAQMTKGADCESRVFRVIDYLVQGDVKDAYRCIRDRKRAGLPWLGAAYGTKMLYFGGYEMPLCVAQRPIILDEFVARGFRHLEGPDTRFHSGWCWRNYEYLLARVGKMASSAVSEDDIEYRLFELGKELPSG